MKKLLPKTAEYLERLEKIYSIFEDEDISYLQKIENLSDEDRYILYNPMLHLAEVICDDTNCLKEKEGMAIDLAKYIFLITGVKRLDIEINAK